MVFSSLLFLFRFLPVVLALYYIVPRKLRNLVLFITSLFFYAWGEPVYVVLLLVSTVLDYTMGRLIGYFREKDNTGKSGLEIHRKKTRQEKICLLISLVVNLGLLGVFKYSDFFIRTVNNTAHIDIPLLGLALPIGISFYTFQTLSYTIDVYRDKVKPQKNIISFGAYVALFPQLIAGPIVRYTTIAKELDSRKETLKDFSEGAVRFATGLAKKVLIANTIGELFHRIAGMQSSELSVFTAWLGVVAFTFQIYYDFSGYSDMAIGLGRMFGFHFPENFEHPYESSSITEFWRRWHISLGTWFKEYVYIPMGGNRKGPARQIFNIAVVWLLTGFWHGAEWNFVLWGVYYGILLVIEKLFFAKFLNKAPSWIGHVYTMILVMIGWAFFCFPDIASGSGYVSALVGQASNGFIDNTGIYLLITNIALIVVAAIGSSTLPKKVGLWVTGKLSRSAKSGAPAESDSNSCSDRDGVNDQNGYMAEPTSVGALKAAFVLVCLLLSVAFLVSDSFNPFLYFRF